MCGENVAKYPFSQPRQRIAALPAGRALKSLVFQANQPGKTVIFSDRQALCRKVAWRNSPKRLLKRREKCDVAMDSGVSSGSARCRLSRSSLDDDLIF